jgi:predicted nucleotidyltransferase
MISKSVILLSIRKSISESEPDAIVILYGSFARGDEKPGSDIDLLILLNKDRISRSDIKRIKYPLYDLEIETGQIISPLVLSKNDWETRHRITPFYENVIREGKVL